MRLDKYLVEHFGYTRNKAQSLIETGLVSVGGKVILKPALEVSGEGVEVRDDPSVYWVSRSAGKLDGFLEELGIKNYEFRISGTSCLDIGSSTGGFTQILLERGALRVDAVDVGTDQLHPSLRDDPRITLYEQTDIRAFQTTTIYDIITVDVSFISLRDIIDSIKRFSDHTTHIFLLFKPQFEVGRENLRKTGVPKSEMIILDAISGFEVFLGERGFEVILREKATVIGEAGNQEWMMWVKKRVKGL